VSSEPHFPTDLYRGTARFYDEFRVGYPRPLLDDLRKRAQLDGAGRLLDLACGTGQITFPLAANFAEVWALDQEPDAIEFARAKARRLGVDNVRWIAGRAEDLDADGAFDLIAIGNAFHRLPRRAVADSAMRALVPGGHLALLWSYSPWDGSANWQRALSDTVHRWTRAPASDAWVPFDRFSQHPKESDTEVVASAGFSIVGEYRFEVPYEWSVETLIGFMYSTSILSQRVLGPKVEAFAADVREQLLAVEPEGVFREEIGFSYTLARRP
jgi:ubiquinone/menaquinone biosynthesis C-methylase UbiE